MEPIFDPEHNELEQALLRAGRDVGMSPELRAKTLATLGLGVGVATATAAKAGTLTWFTSKAGVAWTAALVGTIGAVGALTYTGRQDSSLSNAQQAELPHPPSTAAEPKANLEAKIDGDQDSINDVSRSSASASAVELDDLLESPVTDESASNEKAGSSLKKSVQKAPGLREELAHIARVEAALRASAPQKALALLADYRSAFPRRKLGLEAEVLTIQAMYESGSVAAAQSRARRFLDRHPSSPLGARAKQYLRE